MKLDQIAPYLSASGFVLVAADDDNDGLDDAVGQWLLYGSDLLNAIQADEPMPPPPEIPAIAGKLSAAARIPLMMLGPSLQILQMQIAASNPKLALALRFISQGLTALVSGRAVPLPPPALA